MDDREHTPNPRFELTPFTPPAEGAEAVGEVVGEAVGKAVVTTGKVAALPVYGVVAVGKATGKVGKGFARFGKGLAKGFSKGVIQQGKPDDGDYISSIRPPR